MADNQQEYQRRVQSVEWKALNNTFYESMIIGRHINSIFCKVYHINIEGILHPDILTLKCDNNAYWNNLIKLNMILFCQPRNFVQQANI